jgi:hypothetical protein
MFIGELTKEEKKRREEVKRISINISYILRV